MRGIRATTETRKEKLKEIQAIGSGTGSRHSTHKNAASNEQQRWKQTKKEKDEEEPESKSTDGKVRGRRNEEMNWNSNHRHEKKQGTKEEFQYILLTLLQGLTLFVLFPLLILQSLTVALSSLTQHEGMNHLEQQGRTWFLEEDS